MGGYVYLIGDTDNGHYKIGVTKKEVEKRLKRLQTGNSNSLSIISTFYYSYPFRLETMLHNFFREKRINGEWFILDNDDIFNFNSICVTLSERINGLLENPFFSKNIR